MARGRRFVRRLRPPRGAMQRPQVPRYQAGLRPVAKSATQRPTIGRPHVGGALRRRTRRVNGTHAALAFLIGLNFLLILILASRQPLVIEQTSGGHASSGGGGGTGPAGESGIDGYSALVATMDEAPGVNCAPGGVSVESGLDDGSGGGVARNEVLEPGEVQLTSYVCDGAEGFNTLAKLTTESPGANCAAGGKKVESGLDNGDGGGTARDGTLQAGEVDATTYVCNGAAGSNGADGFNTLAKLTTESPGANCAAGGKKVEVGLDNGDGGGIARNGVLEAGEVDATTYVCNGAAGSNGVDGFNSLMTSTAESAGANCADAGRKLQSGLDNGDGGGTARDGTLQAGEVDVTSYACNGAPGRDAGLLYTYNTGTSGDPGSGKFGFDTVTLSAMATFRISETDGDGNSIAALIATWDDSTTTAARSTISIIGNQAPTRVLVFTITGAITDNGAYDSFAVTYVASAGSHANNDIDKMRQSRTGDQGATGTTGAAGRDVGLKYTYNTGTSGDPGSGKFGFDTTTLSAIATLRISETDGDANGIAAFIATWDDSTTTGARSTITILGDAAPTRLLIFTITSAITDNGAYDSFSVTYVTSAGSHANNDVDKLWEDRTGDKGSTGSTGSNGFSSLMKFTAESAGANCPSGGKKVEAGLDNGDGGGTANDGTLQAGEVDTTQYLCVPNVGGKMVYFMSYGGSTPSTAVQWTNMPAAPTELIGLTSMRIQTNLTGFTQVRFAVGIQTAGAANSFLWLQYSTDNSTFTNACGSTCPEVNTGGTGSKWTAWQTMNSTMAADVLLRVMGQAGDGAADPTFNEVYAEFR